MLNKELLNIATDLAFVWFGLFRGSHFFSFLIAFGKKQHICKKRNL